MARPVVGCFLLLTVARHLLFDRQKVRPDVKCFLLLMVARHLLFDRQKVRPDVVAEVSRGPHNQRSDVRLQISVADDVVVLAEIVVEE